MNTKNTPYPVVFSVNAVANYLLDASRQKKGKSVISNLKMQKLVYIAQGISLAAVGRPLFKDEIQAWTYGPVVPVLYRSLKQYGKNAITGSLASDDSVDGVRWAEAAINTVLNKFGDLESFRLVEFTHQKGSPWEEAWRQGKFTPITNSSIEDYFRRFLPAKPSEA